MTEIAEFIKARLIEKEKKILCEWDSDGKSRVATMWVGSNPDYTTVASDHADDIWVALGEVMENSESITVLWDPKEELAEIQSIREIIKYHEKWPVLIEGPTKFEPEFSTQPNDLVDHYTIQMSRQIAWMIEQEYIKKFGTDPPAAPILRIMANRWKTHPDFKSEWEV